MMTTPTTKPVFTVHKVNVKFTHTRYAIFRNGRKADWYNTGGYIEAIASTTFTINDIEMTAREKYYRASNLFALREAAEAVAATLNTMVDIAAVINANASK